MEVRKTTKIRNRYNQAPHLTQDTNGKVTTSQLDITNQSQEVSPFPAGDHTASINRRARKHNKQDRNNINDPQRNTALDSTPFLLIISTFPRHNNQQSTLSYISLFCLLHTPEFPMHNNQQYIPPSISFFCL